jgi:2-polyprenyl-3-methyl-5-hydroxy-6-metoxy-1,4-benzoquinol methylase
MPGQPPDAWSLRESAEALLLVAAALGSGLLDELARERTAEQAAAALGLDPRATRICLEALEAVGVLERRGRAFLLTSFGRSRFVDPASPSYVGGELPAWRASLPAWLFLGDVLRSGHGLPPDASPEARARLYHALDVKPEARLATVVEEILSRTDAARPRVLDAGGGSGAYARAFAARGCAVTLVDRPETIRHVREAFALDSVAGLVLVEGDLTRALPPGAFEVALLADVVHELPATAARDLLRRVGQVVVPRGVAAVVDLFRGRSPRAAFYAVTLLLHGEGADTHAAKDVVRWLEKGGFGDPRFHDLDAGRSLLTARKDDAGVRRSG